MSVPRVVATDTSVTDSVEAPLPSSSLAGSFVCDHCGRSFSGPPAGSGLYIWTRGDEIRYEEPPLCDDCALTLSTAAMMVFSFEGDDE